MKNKKKRLPKPIKSMLITVIVLGLLFEAFQTIRKNTFFGITHVNTDQKVIALTYDDGPSIPYTEQILKVLKNHHAQATFFVTGLNIDAHPDIIRSIRDADQELGNHTYEHKYMAFRPWWYIKEQVDYTEHLLRDLGVTGTIAFRPPWGRRLFSLPLYLYQKQIPLIIWNIDSDDWENVYTAEQIAENVIKSVKPGSIVLFHDGGGDRRLTVEATNLVLIKLAQQNYHFVTIEKLLKIGSIH